MVYALVLALLLVTLTLLSWQLVHFAPPILSRVLPRGICMAVGGLLFVLGFWSAFVNATISREPDDILFALLRVYVGLWFMLAPTAANRGSETDERFLRRLFGMIGIVTAALVGAFYLNNDQAQALVMLTMIAAGFWVTMDYLRLTDRGG